MVNNIIIVCVLLYTYYGLMDMFALQISDLILYTHKKSKRRIFYKYIYFILFILIVPYLIIDKIIKGGE